MPVKKRPPRRTRWDNYTPEEKEAARKHLAEVKKRWWATATPQEIESIRKRQKWATQQRWDLTSDLSALGFREFRRVEQKRVWAKRSREEKKAIFDKMIATRRANQMRAKGGKLDE